MVYLGKFQVFDKTGKVKGSIYATGSDPFDYGPLLFGRRPRPMKAALKIK